LGNSLGTGSRLDAPQNVVADFVLLELDLGITFLEVAKTTRELGHAHRSISHAVTALRTADRFLAAIRPYALNSDAIEQRRKELIRRYRSVVEERSVLPKAVPFR
jgi:hypothetical protein